jgi:hypothetical protein
MEMEWLYKIISRVEFYVLLVLIATAALFFAVFKDLPNSANGYSPTVRETIVLPLFVFGVAVFVSGLIAFFARVRVRQQIANGNGSGVLESDRSLSTTTSGVTPESASVDPNLATSNEEFQWEEQLVSTYKELPKTQQRVVTLICEMPPVQMPIDDFWKAFSSRFGPKWVRNDSEMYYRIDSLSLRGLCELKKIGPGASVVIRLLRVSKCLRSRDVLVS